MIRRAVGDAERGGGAVVDAIGYPCEPGGRNGDLLGECPVHAGAGHAVADRETSYFRAGFDDDTGELAAGDERGGNAVLVLIGDQEHVGKVHCGGSYSHANLSRLERRRLLFFDADHVRRSVRRADRRSHR